ncbi:MAG: DUF3048 domain-containing protein [Clostridium sp.]|nr:DUF3048 domain-containing protein [Clostridium sp.]
MKKSSLLCCLLIVACIMMAGCKSKDKVETDAIVPVENVSLEPTVEASPSAKPTTTPKETHKGEVRSRLTGEWIDEKLADKRPFAVMLNNIKVASPQSGTSQASILYEAVVEGGITRLMGIFEDFDAERIGSTRSARHYYVSFADEYDAVYVHYGQTKYATAKIKELGVDNLSGLSSLGSTVFYRDNSIKAPHNAFTSYNGIKKGMKAAGYRTKLRDKVNTFTFYKKNTKIKGDNADKVTLGFSNYTSPYLTYNKKKGLYYRYQFGDKHVDRTTGKQLAFKNVIIQIVDEWDIDKNGYQTMDIGNSQGEGYYITNGKAEKITWEKNESKKTRTYYDSNGKELKLNVGKTYIAVYPKKRLANLVIA